VGGFRVLRIKYERLERRWSQAQLAAVARLTQPAVALVENGRLIPTPDQRERLARALDVPTEVLLQPVEIVAEQHA
jgi:transcriptional regulator with XRE-family HTH domain